jgi:hypothetical protein
MVRIKKIALAALVALAVAAGGLAVATPAAPQTLAFSFGIAEPDSEIVATSRGDCTACH